MYTRDDYIRDLYIKENGSGVERLEAELRCKDYEQGRDPETADAERRIERSKHESFWTIPFLISLIVSICFFFSNSTDPLTKVISIAVTIAIGVWAYA